MQLLSAMETNLFSTNSYNLLNLAVKGTPSTQWSFQKRVEDSSPNNLNNIIQLLPPNWPASSPKPQPTPFLPIPSTQHLVPKTPPLLEHSPIPLSNKAKLNSFNLWTPNPLFSFFKQIVSYLIQVIKLRAYFIFIFWQITTYWKLIHLLFHIIFTILSRVEDVCII